ncbi:MAG: hypothetical protein PHE54_03580 [Bacilli bacterium]|nr:hypothetical protein [Bacilli bacterium]
MISAEEQLLNEEKEQLLVFSQMLSTNLEAIDKSFKQLDGIESSLYYEIVFKGLSVTKAIDKVAFKYNKDISTLWKNYYPKVKEKISKLKKH